MANTVAKVASLQGQAWAKEPDGTLRLLTVGDTVTADEVVITATGAKIELDFGDGHPVAIAGGQEVTMNRDLWTDLASDNKDAAVQDASVQEALTVLNNGGDLTETLEETAAGLSGGGSNEGHSFVELTRVVEQTNAEAFNFGINNTNGTTTTESAASNADAPVNRAPITDSQNLSGDEDNAISGQVIARDIENDVLTYAVVNQPANGVLTLNTATGSFVYTPNANYNGPDSFVVTVTDTHGNQSSSTVSLAVNAVNDAPVASNQNLTTPEDTPVSGQVVATDVEGNTLAYSVTTSAAHGTVTLNSATGTFVYTPGANYNGSDSFVVTVSDGQGGTTTSTINIGVTPVNDAPVSSNQNLTTPEDTPISGTVAATDVDGDTLSYAVTSTTTNGTVTLNPATGGFMYTPGANYNGSDSFVVTVSDGKGGTTTSTINIGVTPVNDAPVSSNQNLTTPEDTPISGTVVGTDVDGDTLSYAITSTATNGTVTLNPATGGFVYTPGANYNGSDSFVVTVSDGKGGTTTSTINIGVTPVNDAPVSSNQNLTTPEDTSISGTVVATDVDGDTLSYAITSTVTNGTVTLNSATGGFVYTPGANYNGSDSFVVTVSDGKGGTTTSTINIGVTPVNDAPVSSNQNLSTPEDTPVSGTVVATDVDGDTLSYAVTSTAANGTVTLNSVTGGFVYTPGANYNGSDSFVVTVSDGKGGTTTSTINIGVTPVNDAPVSNNQNLTTPEDTPISGTVVATDVDGDALTYIISSSPSDGLVTINSATGAFVYTPNANYNGGDNFVVSISDGHGGVTTSTITIGVTPVNDAPAATNQNLTTLEDTPISGAINAADPDGDTLTYTLTGTPANGTVSLNPGTGTFVYAPNTNYNGSDIFTVTISDGHGGVTTSTVTIGVTPDNDAPVSSNQNLTTAENVALNGAVVATDVDGDTLGYAITGSPANGSVVLNSVTGAFTYTPKTSYNGPDSFTVTISDGQGGTTTSTINIGVTPVNDVPVANNDSAITNEDTAVTIAVRGNDTDVDGDALTVTGVTQGANGSVVIDAVTGNPIYTPKTGFSGSDNFTYTVSDGHGGTATATVIITVNAVNHAPVTGNQALTTAENTPLNGAIAATDADGDTLSYTINGAPTHGTLLLNSITGTFTYTPANNYNGSDSFSVIIGDGNGGTTTSTINIGVTPVNVAPIAVDDSATTNESTSVTIAVRANDADGDNDLLLVTNVTQGTHGSVVLDAVTNNPIYTPNAGFTGTDTFTYTIDDSNGGTATATVTITVNPVNHAPVANVDSITVAEGGTATSLDGGASSVLDNDVDAENNPLTSILVTGPAHGTLTLNPNGTFSYVHDGSETTSDSFTYKANDGTSDGNTVTVSINVTPVNDDPVANDDYYTINEGQTLSLPLPLTALLANDTDADGDTLWVSGIGNPVNGSFSVVGGNIVFTPTPGFSGTASLTYVASDPTGGYSTAKIYITVLAVDDPTVATADTNTIAEGGVASGNVLINDTDPDSVLSVASFEVNGTTYNAGDTAVIAGVGSVTLASTGQYTFTPIDSNYNGTVPTITYTTNTAVSSTLNITVTPVNDDPVANDDSFVTNMNTSVTIPNSALLVNDTDVDGDSLIVSGVGNIAHGTLSFVGADLVFTPDAGFSGAASFIYGVSDGHGGISYATVNINVINQASVLLPDSATTAEGIATSGNVLLNDSDPDETLSIASFTVNGSNYAAGDTAVIPVIGSITLQANGTYIFTPGPDYNGAVPTLTYTTNTGFSSTLDINVTPVNDAPVAVADSITVDEGGTATILVGGATSVLDNDTDAENDTLNAILVTGPAHGTLTLNADGTFSYTHDGSQTTTDSFTYKVNDGTVDGNTVTVNIGVTPVNNTPVAAGDSYVVAEGGTLLVNAASGVLVNDTDVDGDALNSILVTGPNHGSLTLNADGSFTYIHDGSETTADSFTYKVNDGTVDGNTVTVNIGVTPVNDAPVSTPDSIVVAEGGTVTSLIGGATSVLANDSDAENNPLTAVLVTGPAHGTLTFNSDGTFSYVHDGSETTSDSFTYKANDGTADGNIVTVNIGVTPVNDAPVAAGDSYVVAEGGTLLVSSANGVLVNDTDAEGDILNAILVTGPAHGTLTLNADGTFSYTHDGSATAADSFTYKVNDGTVDGNTVTVNIGVTPINHAPVATPDSITVLEGGTATVLVGGATSVLANDSDVDPDTLNAILVTGPAHGTLTLNANGTFSYTHDGSETTTDSFTYKVNDGTVDGNTVTVNIGVTPVNDAPVTVPDSITVLEGGTATSLVGGATSVLANDTDAENNTLNAVLVTGPTHGTLTLNANGTFSYVHDGSETTTDSFTYKANDGTADGNIVTVNIGITPVNDAPVAVPDNITVLEGGTVSVLIGGATSVLANDTDAENNPLNAILVTGPAHGTLTLNANGTFSYTHDGSETTTDSFTYKVNDGTVDGNTVTVNIGVTPVNDAPVTVPDSITVLEGGTATSLVGGATSVLANDTDAENNTLNAVLVTGPTHGTLTLNANGTFSYVHDGSETTTDSFTYKANDGTADGNIVTVNIGITPVNDAPIAVGDNIIVAEGGTTTILVGGATSVLANDSDAENNPLNAILVTGPAHGTLTLNANGTFSYTHNGSATTADSFTYKVNDGSIDGNTVTVNIGVLPTVGTISLSATPSLTEAGGNIIYTATLTNVQGSDVKVTLANGEIITITAGQLSNTVSTVVAPNEDVYIDPSSVTNSISSLTGGYTGLAVSSGTVSTNITDTIDTTTINLTAAASVNEGGTIVYTATVANAVTGTPLVIHLSNGVDITIPVGGTSANSTAVAVRGDDAYIQGNQTVTVGISSTTGGNYEALNTTSTATTTVLDNGSTTNVVLTAAANVSEGGSIVYTATVGNTVTGTPLVIHLSNGVDITIPVGGTSANSVAVAVRGDDAYIQGNQTVTVGISGTTGGNYEALNISSTATTTVTDNGSVTTVSITGATSIVEGASGTYTLNLTNPAATDVTVTLTYTGTAINGTDYTGATTVTIPANSSSVNFNIAALSDLLTEGTENFTVSIGAASGGGFENLAISSVAKSVVTSIIDVPVNHAPIAVSDPVGTAYSVKLGDASASDLWTTLDSKGLAIAVNPYTINGTAGTLYQGTVDGNANVLGVGGSSPRTVPGTQVFQQIEYDQTTGKSESLELVFNGNLNQATFGVSRLFPGENGGEVGEWSAYYHGTLVTQGTFRLTGTVDHGSFTINTGSLVFDSIKFTALNTNDGTGDGGDYFLTSFSGTGAASANTNYTLAEGGTLNIGAASTMKLLSNDTDADGDSLTLSKINGVNVTDGQTVTLTSGASLVIHTDGSFTYATGNTFNSLKSGQVTTDSFTYTVSDGQGGTSTATATMTVIGKDLTGTSGNDTLVGGSYSEQIVGGAGNDTMTGGLGADTFKWNLNDQGSKGTPAKDVITDFNMAQGDSLHLSDLLQNESSGNLTNYLHFTYDGTNTTVAISNTGSFDGTAGAYTSKVNQTITLNGVNLTTIGTGTDADIITQLKNNGNLITD